MCALVSNPTQHDSDGLLIVNNAVALLNRLECATQLELLPCWYHLDAKVYKIYSIVTVLRAYNMLPDICIWDFSSI